MNLVPQPQISLTIEDQHTGNIVAMVGGRGAKTASRTFNRSTDAMKQPGSTFKIIASYAPAARDPLPRMTSACCASGAYHAWST